MELTSCTMLLISMLGALLIIPIGWLTYKGIVRLALFISESGIISRLPRFKPYLTPTLKPAFSLATALAFVLAIWLTAGHITVVPCGKQQGKEVSAISRQHSPQGIGSKLLSQAAVKIHKDCGCP